MSLNHIFNPKCESPADMESGLVFLPNLLALSLPDPSSPVSGLFLLPKSLSIPHS